MSQTQRATRATFRTLGRTAPPLALALGSVTYWRPGPPVPVRLADRQVHDSARRGTLAHRPTFRGGVRRTAQVATYSWGEPGAPGVLLVHGWRSRASAFGRIVEDLTAAGLRVVTYDAPAHGDSGGRGRTGLDDLDIIRRLSDAENAPWAAVVGHSLGVLAAGIALHEGVRAERFTGISALTSVRSATDWFVRVSGLPLGAAGPLRDRRPALRTARPPRRLRTLRPAGAHRTGVGPRALDPRRRGPHEPARPVRAAPRGPRGDERALHDHGAGAQQDPRRPGGPVQDPRPPGGPGVRVTTRSGAQPHPNAQILP
ncbi:alpha/beta hydrolase [Promicromonospora sp. NFX87]|uniref:alpha/beta hydrolase n=1 Tax=Promicromonospora sp. NFX87 TaxID=3402691 RepID=UPI003AFAE0AF